MAQIFQKRIQIRFREADPARIMYFGNLLNLAHDCFEDFIQTTGLTWQDWFSKSPYLVPIRHTECDYRAPFVPGQFYTIEACVAQIRDTSFQMKYTFKQDDKVHATAKMVHAFLDPQTKQKIAVPAHLRALLTPYLEGSV